MRFQFFLMFAYPSLCLLQPTDSPPVPANTPKSPSINEISFQNCIGEWCDPSHEPYPNIVAVMTGYDILKGNPFATSQSVDPGFSTGYIFSPIQRTSDGTYALHSGVTVRKTLKCILTSSTDTITNLEKYIKSIQSKSSQGYTFKSNLERKVSVGVEKGPLKAGQETTIPPLIDAAYSSSSEYKNNEKFFTEKRGVLTLREATCATYTVQISPFFPPPFNDGFIKALNDLNEANEKTTAAVGGVANAPAEATENAIENVNPTHKQRKIFEKFVKEFGTHFLQQTTMGARTAITRRYSQDEYKKSTDDDIQKCSDARLQLTVKGVGLGTTSNSCKTIDSSLNTFNGKEFEKESVTSFGSQPADTLTEWSKQTFESPLPIKMELRPITDLFSNNYMGNLKGILYNDILKWLKILYNNYCNDYKDSLGIASCHPNASKKCGINDVCDPRIEFCVDAPVLEATLSPTTTHKRKTKRKQKEGAASTKESMTTTTPPYECVKRPCLSNPCKNFGLCNDILNNGLVRYTCECATGWDGLTCEERTDKFEAISTDITKIQSSEKFLNLNHDNFGNELHTYLINKREYDQFNFAVNVYDSYEESKYDVHATIGDKYFKSFNTKHNFIVGFSKKTSKVPTEEHLNDIENELDRAIYNSQITVDNAQKAVNEVYAAYIKNLSLCEVFPQPCHFHASCYARPDAYNCECNKGFFGDGYTCYDINECLEQSCSENSFCVNIIGSFLCICQNGFQQKNTSLCEDINECFERSPCDKNAVCINTQGSFTCKCNGNYSGNGIDCIYQPIICETPNNNLFPSCNEKIQWLLKVWRTHPCYARQGVDGSRCSIISYLSEIEEFCPLFPGKSKRVIANGFAELNPIDVDSLIKYVLHNNGRYDWIKNRILTLQSKWIESYRAFSSTQNLFRRKKKYILIFPGILAEKKWSWSIKAGKGGPLGELVQWADLIAGLYILGHEVFVTDVLERVTFSFPCYTGVFQIDNFDLIYTDMHGMKLLENFKQFNFIKNKCKLRVLDSFGTEARFNYLEPIDERYSGWSINEEKKKQLLLGNQSYAGWKLNLKQFLTMFPHSDDNSFLGFVVATDAKNLVKDNIALVYGKQDYMWKKCLPYLSYINMHLFVYGNVLPDADADDDDDDDADDKKNKKLYNVPSFVINHGLMSFDKLQKLLETTKIFVGLGFPFEGPAPLEAIGKGAVFLNPKFSVPFNKLNDVVLEKQLFFENKPTLRKITSQHPYLELFVGKPNVYTIDISNKSEVVSTITEILEQFEKNNILPYVPFEFTFEGFLQRLNAYLEHQNFCDATTFWPPKSSVEIILSSVSESCSKACLFQGMVCDSSLYVFINDIGAFKNRSVVCDSYVYLKSLYAPYFNTANGTCVLQKENLLFSCVDSSRFYKRLCPCRKFIKGQVALCTGCV